MRSTSSRQRSAFTSPLRSPASPARHTPAYHSGPSTLAATRRRAYCSKSHGSISGRSTLYSPIRGALSINSQSTAYRIGLDSTERMLLIRFSLRPFSTSEARNAATLPVPISSSRR